MTSPLDDAGTPFVVLVNDRDELSLWPAWAAVPDGWSVCFGPAERSECVSHVEAR